MGHGSQVPDIGLQVLVPGPFRNYCKVRQKNFHKVRQVLQGLTDHYYKVWQIFQSVTKTIQNVKAIITIVTTITK